MIACNSSEKWLYDRIYCPSNRSKQMQETHMVYSAGTQFSLNEKQHTWLSQTITVRLVIFEPVLGFKRALDMHRTILAFAELFMVLYRTLQCSKYNVDFRILFLECFKSLVHWPSRKARDVSWTSNLKTFSYTILCFSNRWRAAHLLIAVLGYLTGKVAKHEQENTRFKLQEQRYLEVRGCHHIR